MRLLGVLLQLIGILLCLTVIGFGVGAVFMICGVVLMAFGGRRTVIIRERNGRR